jgi:uncharacterized protein YpuA (DUF1002 family)
LFRENHPHFVDALSNDASASASDQLYGALFGDESSSLKKNSKKDRSEILQEKETKKKKAEEDRLKAKEDKVVLNSSSQIKTRLCSSAIFTVLILFVRPSRRQKTNRERTRNFTNMCRHDLT